jgi:hypothetical protein
VVVTCLVTASCTSSGSSSDGGGFPSWSASHGSPAAPYDPRTAPLPDTRGPRTALVGAGQVLAGDDWSLPTWARPRPNSGFYSEHASTPDDVYVRSVDVSWRQVQPTRGGAIDRTSSGQAQGISMAPLANQLAQPGPFWMRLFASGVDWAPQWLPDTCHVHGYGPDGDGEKHLPIWNECVWSALMTTYKAVFVDSGLRADPRLRFVYVPGAFTWTEYDYDIIEDAVKAGDLDQARYLSWYSHAWQDLVDLFGPYRTKLVFTGEDYPFGPFGASDDLLAAKATATGMGIRNGITEEFDFHLSQAPAYGSTVAPNGHLSLDESLPVHDGRFVVGVENECYNDCGFTTTDPYYAVRQSNLKALQLLANWVYVVPAASYLDPYRSLWDWVRLELGTTATTAPDAWADLRDAEDYYWRPGGDGDASAGTGSDVGPWAGRPFVRNLERWLVQVDRPGSVAHRSTVDVHRGVLAAENGTAYEGLATDVAHGDTGLAFTLDPAFAAATRGDVLVKVTWRPIAGKPPALRVEYPTTGGAAGTAVVPSQVVGPTDATGSTGGWITSTVALPGAALTGTLSGGGTLRVGVAGSRSEDVAIRFVRLVRQQSPSGVVASPSPSSDG